MNANTLIGWKTLRPMVGNLGRTTWWRLVRAGEAPAPIRISPGRVAWRLTDILDWIASR
ncbi:helix-turn-helix transcriptional regulator [Phenylobacterium kunshanense]|uniref:Helix-turn-helix domain-containing protein n=1 Tax=Phenylobacterium kunshanense TaxID=1445034 RepID=A0A328BL23_9CAUL|nr:AlpA family phage regulatory protein [Phenylobacterium kunshanense]RAK65648.1 helix-turn-helix domain-containing protein [Phenylobacterium kunshanense]